MSSSRIWRATSVYDILFGRTVLPSVVHCVSGVSGLVVNVVPGYHHPGWKSLHSTVKVAAFSTAVTEPITFNAVGNKYDTSEHAIAAYTDSFPDGRPVYFAVKDEAGFWGVEPKEVNRETSEFLGPDPDWSTVAHAHSGFPVRFYSSREDAKDAIEKIEAEEAKLGPVGSIKRPPVWLLNGTISPEKSPRHYFIKPSDYELAGIEEKAFDTGVIVLHGPRQSGKSTMAVHLPRVINNRKLFYSEVEFPDGGSYEDFFQWLYHELASTRVAVGKPESAYPVHLFTYIKDNNILLVMDEFDRFVVRSSKRDLGMVLDTLRKWGHTFPLICIGPPLLRRLATSSGSPFNNANYEIAKPFTAAQVRILFDQFREERGVTVTDEVLEIIMEHTQGVRGIVVQMGMAMQQLQPTTLDLETFKEEGVLENAADIVYRNPSCDRLLQAIGSDRGEAMKRRVHACYEIFDMIRDKKLQLHELPKPPTPTELKLAESDETEYRAVERRQRQVELIEVLADMGMIVYDERDYVHLGPQLWYNAMTRPDAPFDWLPL